MFDCASCVRISSAITPPPMKKISEASPRFSPMRLWSVLVSAPIQPPSGRTRAGGAVATLTARGSFPCSAPTRGTARD